jgi:hypothetical protein
MAVDRRKLFEKGACRRVGLFPRDGGKAFRGRNGLVEDPGKHQDHWGHPIWGGKDGAASPKGGGQNRRDDGQACPTKGGADRNDGVAWSLKGCCYWEFPFD